MRLIENRPEFDLRALLKSTDTPYRTVTHPPQTMIFMQGEACDTVMYIDQGSVRLAISSPSGKEAICGVLTAGAFLGECALRGDSTRRHTAVTMTPTTVTEVSASRMQALLYTQPGLLDRFINHVLSRHVHLEADLTDQIINAGEQRLARALLHLAGCTGGDAGPRPLPPISQEHLAKMVGTTRSRVNAFMGKFKKLGFLHADGGVLLVNPSLRHVLRGSVSAPALSADRAMLAHGTMPPPHAPSAGAHRSVSA
jgi:CRP-like cAMP-binding protein